MSDKKPYVSPDDLPMEQQIENSLNFFKRIIKSAEEAKGKGNLLGTSDSDIRSAFVRDDIARKGH